MTGARLVGDRIVRSPDAASQVELSTFVDEWSRTFIGVVDAFDDPIGVAEDGHGDDPSRLILVGIEHAAVDSGTAAWLLPTPRARTLARLILARADEIEKGA